jgi:predicted CXXCH cytochrome family protein
MKRVLAIITAVAITAAATAAFALSIVGTKHDLSTGTGGNINSGGGSDQICIYCHTPHNATQAIPLWNRSNPVTKAFKFYSSPTMTLKHATSDKFESTSISLFCMSCHDGGAIGGRVKSNGGVALTGASTGAGKPAITLDVITGAGNLGIDLSDDHPVNLELVLGGANAIRALDSTNKIGVSGGGGLNKSLPLFKSDNGNNYIECATCHAVHDNIGGKFLRTTNTGSKLCLACHIK